MVDSVLTLRDWGTSEVVRMHEGHQVQQLTINPGASFPLRVNDYQCEHWVIIYGMGRMTLDAKSFLIDEGGSVFIPARASHLVENIGDIPLRIVAVQYGAEYHSARKDPRQGRREPPMFQ